MKYYLYETAVRYADLAENGCLSATAALGMMQEAAALASATCGLGPMDTQKTAWALVGWKLHFHQRPRWNTPLTVRTWPRTMSNHTSDRDFIITDAAGEKVITATSRWLLLDTVTGRVAKVTDEILSRYELGDERAMDAELPANGKCPPGSPCTFTYTVLRRDIDTLHHVNNLHYLSLARQALPEELSSAHFADIEIIYKRQIKLGATVHFFYSPTEDGKHLVEIKDENDLKTHALIWFA